MNTNTILNFSYDKYRLKSSKQKKKTNKQPQTKHKSPAHFQSKTARKNEKLSVCAKKN
jgi:hypothetical protein